MNESLGTRLSHHRLHVYADALELVRFVHAQRIRDASLRDQATRAAASVALNVAEGAGREGKASQQCFRIARGSAIEVVAAYEVADATGDKLDVRRVQALGATIAGKLTRLVL